MNISYGAPRANPRPRGRQSTRSECGFLCASPGRRSRGWICAWLVASVSSCRSAPSTHAADQPKAPAVAGETHELTSQEIRGRVMGQLPKVRRCYEVEFNTGKGAAEGSVTFRWKIAPSGAV